MAHAPTIQAIVAGINDQIRENPKRPAGHQLAGHQIDALNDVVDWTLRPTEPKIPADTAGVQGKLYAGSTIDMATSTGKTWVGLAMAAGAAKRGVKVIIASPRLLINSKFVETAAHPERFGLAPDSIARYDSDATPEERQRVIDGTAPIILTTPAGLRALDRDGVISPDSNNPKFRGLLVLDEADLFDGFATSRVVKKYNKESAVWSPSATNFDTRARLYDNQPSAHNLPLHDPKHPEKGAVKRGLTVPGIKTAILEVEPFEWDVRAMIKEAMENGEISDKAAEDFARNKAVRNAVVNFVGTHVDKHLGPIREVPILVTVPTIAAAKEYANDLNKKYGEGFASGVSGETPQHDKVDAKTGEVVAQGLDTQLDRFNNGNSKLRVLVYPDVLGRGVDLPNASVIISTRPYVRPSPVVQDLGRIVRKGTPDFAERFGVPKNSALAVNVQSPELRPYTYSQVIGGPVLWQSGEPKPYEKAGPVPPKPQLPPVEGKVRITTEFSELQSLYEDAEQAFRERQGIIPTGFINLNEAAVRLGKEEEVIKKYVSKIIPDRQYTTIGKPPGAEGGDPIGTPTVAGKELKQNIRGRTVVSEILIERLAQRFEDIQKHKEDPKTTTEDQFKERYGVDTKDVSASYRRTKQKEEHIKEKNGANDNAAPDGLAAQGDQQAHPDGGGDNFRGRVGGKKTGRGGRGRAGDTDE